MVTFSLVKNIRKVTKYFTKMVTLFAPKTLDKNQLEKQNNGCYSPKTESLLVALVCSFSKKDMYGFAHESS